MNIETREIGYSKKKQGKVTNEKMKEMPILKHGRTLCLRNKLRYQFH